MVGKKKQLVQWIKQWERTDKVLREIKKQELKAYDYQKNLPIINGMLQWACDHSQPSLSSGLLEQQKFFKKLRVCGK